MKDEYFMFNDNNKTIIRHKKISQFERVTLDLKNELIRIKINMSEDIILNYVFKSKSKEATQGQLSLTEYEKLYVKGEDTLILSDYNRFFAWLNDKGDNHEG